MKNNTWTTLATVFLIGMGAYPLSSHAKMQKSIMRYSQSAAEAPESRGSSFEGFSLGISTIQNTGGNGSITALLGLGKLDALQFYLSIPSTLNIFNVGGIVHYKRTVLDYGISGLHLGVGVGVASVNGAANSAALGVNVTGLFGIHLETPGVPRLKFHFDAGPNIALVTPSGSNFTLGGLSPALGLSALYTL